MTSIDFEEIEEAIRNKHSIRVPRPLWQQTLIISGIILLVFLVLKLAAYQFGITFKRLDAIGGKVYCEYPKDFAKHSKYERQTHLFLGLLPIEVGNPKVRYYFDITLQNGEKIQHETTCKEYEAVGFFSGLEVEYVIGKFSGVYHIKAVRKGNASENGLLKRLYNAAVHGK